jgi:hypothetical protein
MDERLNQAMDEQAEACDADVGALHRAVLRCLARRGYAQLRRIERERLWDALDELVYHRRFGAALARMIEAGPDH